MPGESTDKIVEQCYEQVRRAALACVGHLKDMYPAALQSVPSTAERSLKNFTMRQMNIVLGYCTELIADRVVYIPMHDEPSFILLARDPQAPRLVEMWAQERNMAEPESQEKVRRAQATAKAMRKWKKTHHAIGMRTQLADAMSQVGNDGIKEADGTVTYDGIFNMAGVNQHMTALNVYRGPDGNYLIHVTDGSHPAFAMGFLDRSELTALRDSLNKELAA